MPKKEQDMSQNPPHLHSRLPNLPPKLTPITLPPKPGGGAEPSINKPIIRMVFIGGKWTWVLSQEAFLFPNLHLNPGRSTMGFQTKDTSILW
jgi:hypothetical protein